jgi:hypothetical protein
MTGLPHCSLARVSQPEDQSALRFVRNSGLLSRDQSGENVDDQRAKNEQADPALISHWLGCARSSGMMHAPRQSVGLTRNNAIDENPVRVFCANLLESSTERERRDSANADLLFDCY